MPAVLRRARETSQAETSALLATSRVVPIGTQRRRRPAGARASLDDRRGPMRPGGADADPLAADRLDAGDDLPHRRRRRRWARSRSPRRQLIDRPASRPPSLAPFVIGALAIIWSLSTIHAYAFAQREGLGRHLVRVGGRLRPGGALPRVPAERLPSGGDPPRRLRPLVPGQLRRRSSACTCLWWAMVRRWRAKGRLTPNIVVVGANQQRRAADQPPR